MEFRLIYEGQLPSEGKALIKHEIRKQFHVQLAELWDKHRTLQLAKERHSLGSGGSGTFLNKLAKKFELEGFHFVPLINATAFGLVCELDILFMRRGVPGNLLIQGGDIDNRIKTLLDALRIPHNKNEVVGSPDVHEQPYFFCLLEDDALVTRINVNTDRLLKPLKPEIGHPENEVFLVIHVVAKAAESLTLGNVTFREITNW
jgi:hypothetical protein